MTELTPSSQLHKADYWGIFFRRRWTVFSFFIICFTTVTLGTFLATPLYRASTTMLIEGENTNVLNATDSTTDSANFNIYENYIETQIAVIKSDKIAGRVFADFKLAETPRYRKNKILGKEFKKKFKDDIKIARVRDTRMIEISVFNPDAKLSAEIANILADVYSQDNLKRRALSFIRNQQMASLNADFLRLQSKYDSLSNVYGPKHPEMLTLTEEIRLMSERVKKARTQVDATPEGQDQSEERKLLEDTLLNIQENSVLSSSKMNNISIVDRALVPIKVAKPNRLVNITLGFLLGLMGGVMLAFVMDYFDDTVKSESDAKRMGGGTIFLGSLLSEKSPKCEDNDLMIHTRRETASAEEYRLLRTRVLWSLSADHFHKDLAILSSMPGEGKTTVASNLAIAFTQLNKKVLLVDTDIRKGRLHKAYGLPNDKGLAHYLTDKMSFGSVINKTEIPNLSVVTCGKSVIDSSQLFSSAHMDKFLEEAKAHFDMVIYDTPPVTIISDTLILISKIGVSILVMRSGVSTTRIVSKGFSTIRESKANLIGIILNASSSQDDKIYRHYYHAYQKS